MLLDLVSDRAPSPPILLRFLPPGVGWLAYLSRQDLCLDGVNQGRVGADPALELGEVILGRTKGTATSQLCDLAAQLLSPLLRVQYHWIGNLFVVVSHQQFGVAIPDEAGAELAG